MSEENYEDLSAQEKSSAKPTSQQNDVKSIELSEITNIVKEKIKPANKGLSPLTITVEPICFCNFFALALTSSMSIDLLERSICMQKFNFTLFECSDTLPIAIKSSTEAMTANINMTMNLIQGSFPLLLAIVIGPWSDTNGRKPFISWALKGYAMFYLLWGVLSIFPSVPVIYYVLPSVFISLTGGNIALQSIFASYVCDVFVDSQRTFRLALKNCCGVIGTIMGNVLAPVIKNKFSIASYQVAYLSSFLVIMASVLYTSLFLKETVIKGKSERTKIFDWVNFKSMFVTLLYKPKRGTLTSILIMIIITTEVTAYQGDKSISYLVTKSQYNWSLDQFSFFSAVTSLISALGPLFLVWFLGNRLHFGNLTIILITSTMIAFMELLKGFSCTGTMYIIAQSVLSCFNELIGPSADTELATIVSSDDLGKAFAYIAFMDATSPVISQPIYTEIYKLLLPLNLTSYVFFLSAFCGGLLILSSIGLMYISREKSTTSKDVL